MTKQLQSS